MSSHHPAVPQLRHAEARTGEAVGPNGATGPGINGLTASFHDQQTGQRVDATPVTPETAPAYAALRARTAGAGLLSGPPARPGDWVVAQGAGPQAQVVIGADFLRRFAPADERAQRLLRWLDQTAGGAGAGDPGVAARRLRDAAIP
jgi:hypothetical protein